MKFEYHTEIECDKDQKRSGKYENTLAGQHQCTKQTEGSVVRCFNRLLLLSAGECGRNGAAARGRRVCWVLGERKREGGQK